MENKDVGLTCSNTDLEVVKKEKVRVIPLHVIDDAPEHPFCVLDDPEMEALMESISLYGVITPCIVRKKTDERYEMISGHRRKRACARLGIDRIPVVLRNLSKEEAVVLMVDANLQRERILPSEKAFAYKMKLEALKRQGRRTDLTSTPVVSKLRTNEAVGLKSKDSREQVRRYIRLTNLIPELLEDVDLGKIAFRPAVELSYLTVDEQKDVSYTIDMGEATPSLAQAIQMRRLSEDHPLDFDTITKILTVPKPNQIEKIKIPVQKLKKYFGRDTTPKEIEEIILAALEAYYVIFERTIACFTKEDGVDKTGTYERWSKTGELYFVTQSLSSANFDNVKIGDSASSVCAIDSAVSFDADYAGIDAAQMKYNFTSYRILSDGIMIIKFEGPMYQENSEKPLLSAYTVSEKAFYPYNSDEVPEEIATVIHSPNLLN